MIIPAPCLQTRSFIAVDEGLDRIIRMNMPGSALSWTVALQDKCRVLQLLDSHRVLAVTDRGYIILDVGNGVLLRRADLFGGGVISAQRLPDGRTFVAGLNLGEARGVCFVELDPSDRLRRTVSFPGDYVRRSTLTATDTILFTCDSRVFEGDWTGRILREFVAPGFRHAWKADRTDDGRTLISAGYGAFVVEFGADHRVLRRWQCAPDEASLRPHFFGDFCILPNGGLLVCNWLGHGVDNGATGMPLIQFSAEGQVVGGWQDPAQTSSLQTFILLD